MVQVMQEVNYKNLETRVHRGKDTKVEFRAEDKIELHFGIENGKPVVNIHMPWGGIYNIGTYATEEKAREEFEKYDSALNEGRSIKVYLNPHYIAIAEVS